MTAASGNPKPEGRRPKEARRPKSETATGWAGTSSPPGAETSRPQRSVPFSSDGCAGAAGFGLQASDFFRVSDFGLRVWRLCAIESVEEPLP